MRKQLTRRPQGRSLVLIEGLDYSGKTTLARWISQHRQMVYLYGGIRALPELQYTVASLHDRDIVLDRGWISDRVYQPILRPTMEPGAYTETWNRVAHGRQVLVVYVNREDAFEQQKKHEKDHPYPSAVWCRMAVGFMSERLNSLDTYRSFDFHRHTGDLDGWASLHLDPWLRGEPL